MTIFSLWWNSKIRKLSADYKAIATKKQEDCGRFFSKEDKNKKRVRGSSVGKVIKMF